MTTKMFSNDICRACLSDFNDLSDMVPLFDVYQNVYYYRLCDELQLPIDENDQLARNLCKSCAEEVSKSHKFRMMYIESTRKLYEMLSQQTDDSKENLIAFEDAENILQTTLETSDLKWKCDKCSARFEKRSTLRPHVDRWHRLNKIPEFEEMEKSNSNKMERWKCIHCFANFRTRKLKYEHQKEHHQSSDPIETSKIMGMHHDDELEAGNQNTDVHSDNNSPDDDSSYREMKFIQSFVKIEMMTDPGLDIATNDAKSDSLNKCEGDHDIEILENDSKEKNSEVIIDKWKCKMCVMCFRTRKLLQEHNQLHRLQKDENTLACVDEPQNNSEFRWNCKQCSDTFRTRDLLTKHRKIHPSVPKEWQCTVCQATFPSREACKIHRKVEHRNNSNEVYGNESYFKTFTCAICEKIFPSKVKIRQHIQKHKNKEEKKRLCTICGVICASTNGLNRHIRIVHNRERNFHCTKCDSRFTSAYRRKMHMNRDEGIRPFSCEVCGKSFYGKSALYTHRQSIHLNVNKFICQICSKAFNRIDNLRSHLRKIHQYQQPNGGGSDSNL